MALDRTIGSLFEKDPTQWGLRGDPHLWREMGERFAGVLAPDTADELVAVVEKEFEVLTGHPMSETAAYFFLEHFNHGGMSGGCICPAFWREQALPLLIQRYQTL